MNLLMHDRILPTEYQLNDSLFGLYRIQNGLSERDQTPAPVRIHAEMSSCSKFVTLYGLIRYKNLKRSCDLINPFPHNDTF